MRSYHPYFVLVLTVPVFLMIWRFLPNNNKLEPPLSLQQREQLPPPRYMVVALHSNIEVFPQIMTQVQPQVNKSWSVYFVAAQQPSEPDKNWSVVSTSKPYKDLSAIVHSITFSRINTTARGKNIANDFAYDHLWWNATPGTIEYFWLLQEDAAVCSTNSNRRIEDFFGWDYLGAPWSRPQKKMTYGNGGFSLRSRRLQLECTQPSYFDSHRDQRNWAEDQFFSACLRDKNMKFRVAPVEVARNFSSERVVVVGSFGWHLQSSFPICAEPMIRYCPEGLSAYKRWGCAIPEGLTAP